LQVDLDRYSAWVKWTEWLDLIGWSQDAKQLTEWLADMAAITRDTLVREVLANCASSVTMSNGGGTPTHLNATDLDTAVQTLMGYADTITPMITAGKGVGTTPIAPAYIAIGHTDLWSTLINVAGFREVQVYASNGGAYENEVGSTRHIRWLLTRNAKKVSTTYTVPLLGTKAYGTVKLPAGEQMLGYKPPEQSGSPTNAWSIYFYKFWAASKILDDTRMLRLICTT
jgi:N4-gp56 family major capsid protein